MKRSYHTNLIIQYKLGILPIEVLKQIPSSTKHNWNKMDLRNIFGYNPNTVKNDIQLLQKMYAKKHFFGIARILFFICETLFPLPEKLVKKSKELFEVIVVIIDKAKETLGLARILRLLKISQQKYYYWKNKIECRKSLFGFCRKQHPGQLRETESETVKKYLSCERYTFWSLSSVYWQMMRDRAASMFISTFYKYAAKFNIARYKSFCRSKKHAHGIRADASLKILHMDVTIYRSMDNMKTYIYIIQDNFSRVILGLKASLRCLPAIAVENLKEVFRKYNLLPEPVQLIVDGGHENNGEVNEFISSKGMEIKKLVAQKDIVFSNSMVEAANKRLKYDFLFTRELSDFESVKKFLEMAVPSYNSKPLHSLFGHTPLEVLNGAIPDKNRFKHEIAMSRKKRFAQNSQTDCLKCST